MEIETLKKSHLKRNILIALVVVLIISAIILQFTRARYRVTKSIPLVNGVINYTAPDLNIVAIYIDGISTDNLPSGSYKLTSESYCEVDGERAEVTLSYDSSTRALSVTPFTTRGTKCTLYFEEVSSAVNIIEGLYENNQDILAYDGTEDNNLRYIGADPDNYVYFNCSDYANPSSSTCELWRIIGIFDENSHGISGEKLIKIIKYDLDDVLNRYGLAWDSDNVNNWSTSSLQDTLNGDYLNRTGDYNSTGITAATRDMIETVTWKLGGRSNANATAATFYTAERGTTVYSGRPTTWRGKIALMYPSDYGYATNGGSGSIDRDDCLNRNLSEYETYVCYAQNWLDPGSDQWMLTSSSSYSNRAFILDNNGTVTVDEVDLYLASGSHGVLPTLYLISNITITGGSGTSTNPYTLNAI